MSARRICFMWNVLCFFTFLYPVYDIIILVQQEEDL
jgi:hypothetical protein